MASGGDVSKRCRKMIGLNHYTFLYGSMRWPAPKTRHAHLRPAQVLAGRAMALRWRGFEARPLDGKLFPTRGKAVFATPEPADTHRGWLG